MKHVPAVSPEGLRERLAQRDKLCVLDVREAEEYNEGHIGEAILIPLGELGARLAELDKEKEIVVYCQKGSPTGRCMQAAELLTQHWFSDVKHLSGGFLAWKKQTA